MSMSQLGETRIDVPSRVLRYTVPVDDNDHPVAFAGEIIHVATREDRHIEFWTRAPWGEPSVDRVFRVYGTGQTVPSDAVYLGTAVAPGGLLVWHLFSVTAAEREATA